jgi:predicted DNA-binding transcriptional regulator AlpA
VSVVLALAERIGAGAPAVTLAGLRRAAELLPPGSSLSIPREALLALAETEPAVVSVSAAPDRLLDVTEAAALLCVAPRWLYRHASNLPFTRRIGAKALRFSERGLHRWLERQSSGGLAPPSLR